MGLLQPRQEIGPRYCQLHPKFSEVFQLNCQTTGKPNLCILIVAAYWQLCNLVYKKKTTYLYGDSFGGAFQLDCVWGPRHMLDDFIDDLEKQAASSIKSFWDRVLVGEFKFCFVFPFA